VADGQISRYFGQSRSGARVTEADTAVAGGSTDLKHYDIHERNIRVNAESAWQQMRGQPGLPHCELYGGFYFAAKFKDMREVMLKHGLFSSGSGITLPEACNRSRHIPAEIDPPLHRSYRAIMQGTLTGDKVNAMQPAVRQIVAELLDALGQQSRVEFFNAFARPLPVYVMTYFLGLPREDGRMIDELVVELHNEVATGRITGGARRLTEYAERVIDQREASNDPPRDDFVGTVIRGTLDERPLTRDEKVNMVRQVLIGAFDTTSLTIAAGVWWFAQHPEDAQRLRDDPSLMNTASEEIVRFASASTYLRRTVTQETTVGGTQLAPGDKVLLCFGAANRDPAAFKDPDRLILDRTPIQHLGFGLGVHRCIGSHLAKLQLREAFTQLLSRYPHMRLDPDGDFRTSSGLGQGFIQLPVILGPRSA
jgi:cytochrome P450